MNKVKLNNGIEIPQLGLGVFQTPEGSATRDAVTWALQAGYRHIDTAKVYGNEKSVGDGIKASGVNREDIFLTTKLWNEDIRQGRALAAFNESLQRLQTDYVDLYLIHWPADGFEAAWQVLEDLYKEGRVRAIGVSNFHAQHLAALESIMTVPPVVNQLESHPYFANQELIDLCHTKQMAVEAWSPLGGTGGSLLADTVLNELAEKYHKSAAQIVIRWHLQRGIIVIPKSLHQERIRANSEVFDFELSAADMARINGLNQNRRVGANPDTFDF